MGRIDAIARGCRRAKSALMNAAEPFCAGEYVLNFAHGRYAVSQCQIKSSFYELRMDYDKLVHGFYWLSLLEGAVMPGRARPGVVSFGPAGIGPFKLYRFASGHAHRRL